MQVAKSGFLLQRKVTISPTRGPIGTTITIKVVGMGSPTYESVGSVLYDNRFTGSLAANTTRGVVTFKLRAAGDVGAHWIEYAGSSHTVPYLNMEQSPVPWTDSHRRKFTVTKDAGVAGRSGRVAGSREPDDRRAHDPVGGEPHGSRLRVRACS